MIIDQLPSITIANDSDEIAIEQGTATKKITKKNFLKEVNADIGDVSDLSGFTATDLTGAANELKSNLNDKVSKSGDTMSGNLTMHNSSPGAYAKNSEVDITNATYSQTTNSIGFRCTDKNGWNTAIFTDRFLASGATGVWISGWKRINGANVNNTMSLYVNPDGTKTVAFSDPGAWRSALGFGTSGALPITIAQGGTGQTGVEVTQVVTDILDEASGFTVSSAAYSQFGKVACVNITASKTTAQTTVTSMTVATLKTGKRPRITAPCVTAQDNLNYGYISYNGEVRVRGTLTAGTSFSIIATYILQ